MWLSMAYQQILKFLINSLINLHPKWILSVISDKNAAKLIY